MKLQVPLRMPCSDRIWLAARHWDRAAMMGTPPATLASKAMARPCRRAASKTSAPCVASSALLAVTTSLPAASRSQHRLPGPVDAADQLDGDLDVRIADHLSRSVVSSSRGNRDGPRLVGIADHDAAQHAAAGRRERPGARGVPAAAGPRRRPRCRSRSARRQAVPSWTLRPIVDTLGTVGRADAGHRFCTANGQPATWQGGGDRRRLPSLIGSQANDDVAGINREESPHAQPSARVVQEEGSVSVCGGLSLRICRLLFSLLLALLPCRGGCACFGRAAQEEHPDRLQCGASKPLRRRPSAAPTIHSHETPRPRRARLQAGATALRQSLDRYADVRRPGGGRRRLRLALCRPPRPRRRPAHLRTGCFHFPFPRAREPAGPWPDLLAVLAGHGVATHLILERPRRRADRLGQRRSRRGDGRRPGGRRGRRWTPWPDASGLVWVELSALLPPWRSSRGIRRSLLCRPRRRGRRGGRRRGGRRRGGSRPRRRKEEEESRSIRSSIHPIGAIEEDDDVILAIQTTYAAAVTLGGFGGGRTAGGSARRRGRAADGRPRAGAGRAPRGWAGSPVSCTRRSSTFR